ncbi:hypothetical protein HDU96_005968 [Phlyctochytrium bullatum]|nr:hypothetical protein HDU96_005968 [Phlyctochytrium bullatum]
MDTPLPFVRLVVLPQTRGAVRTEKVDSQPPVTTVPVAQAPIPTFAVDGTSTTMATNIPSISSITSTTADAPPRLSPSVAVQDHASSAEIPQSTSDKPATVGPATTLTTIRVLATTITSTSDAPSQTTHLQPLSTGSIIPATSKVAEDFNDHVGELPSIAGGGSGDPIPSPQQSQTDSGSTATGQQLAPYHWILIGTATLLVVVGLLTATAIVYRRHRAKDASARDLEEVNERDGTVGESRGRKSNIFASQKLQQTQQTSSLETRDSEPMPKARQAYPEAGTLHLVLEQPKEAMTASWVDRQSQTLRRVIGEDVQDNVFIEAASPLTNGTWSPEDAWQQQRLDNASRPSSPPPSCASGPTSSVLILEQTRRRRSRPGPLKEQPSRHSIKSAVIRRASVATIKSLKASGAAAAVRRAQPSVVRRRSTISMFSNTGSSNAGDFEPPLTQIPVMSYRDLYPPALAVTEFSDDYESDVESAACSDYTDEDRNTRAVSPCSTLHEINEVLELADASHASTLVRGDQMDRVAQFPSYDPREGRDDLHPLYIPHNAYNTAPTSAVSDATSAVSTQYPQTPSNPSLRRPSALSVGKIAPAALAHDAIIAIPPEPQPEPQPALSAYTSDAASVSSISSKARPQSIGDGILRAIGEGKHLIRRLSMKRKSKCINPIPGPLAIPNPIESIMSWEHQEAVQVWADTSMPSTPNSMKWSVLNVPLPSAPTPPPVPQSIRKESSFEVFQLPTTAMTR